MAGNELGNIARWTINTCPDCGALLDRRRNSGGWWCDDHGEAIPPIAVEVVPADQLRGAVEALRDLLDVATYDQDPTANTRLHAAAEQARHVLDRHGEQ